MNILCWLILLCCCNNGGPPFCSCFYAIPEFCSNALSVLLGFLHAFISSISVYKNRSKKFKYFH